MCSPPPSTLNQNLRRLPQIANYRKIFRYSIKSLIGYGTTDARHRHQFHSEFYLRWCRSEKTTGKSKRVLYRVRSEAIWHWRRFSDYYVPDAMLHDSITSRRLFKNFKCFFLCGCSLSHKHLAYLMILTQTIGFEYSIYIFRNFLRQLNNGWAQLLCVH